MEAVRTFWAKSLLNKAVVLSVIGLLCCCPLALAGGGQRGGSAQLDSPAGGAGAAAPAATEPPAGPTSTPEPTATSAPTATPEPTATPAPTATPVPPIELSGTGQFVTDPLALPSAVNLVTLTHQGRRNFIVKMYATGDTGGEELLVNTIGDYRGIRPVFAPAAFFEIDADGPWTLRIEAIGAAQDVALGAVEVGDWASGVFMPERSGPTRVAVKHDGQRNFVVRLHCASGTELVQNEIGPVDGSTVVRFGEGPCLWEVQADGVWMVAVN